MKFNCILLSLWLILWCAGVGFAQKPIRDLQPTVILISLDGFRADYLEKYDAPNLRKLAKSGVRAKWLTPVYPSLTFPNHYAIATGLYAENNGIVGNSIYDSKLKRTFGLSKREEVQSSDWWLGEPIWVTAEKQNQRAAAFFFPGTEAEIAGTRPTFWKEYDGKIDYQIRTNQILTWLDLPANERPTFFTLYYEEPDYAGHEFSPDSPEVAAAVKKVDAEIGRLVKGLKKRKINDKINLVIVSDHGMATVKPENFVIMDDFFDAKRAEKIVWGGQVMHIFPKNELEENSLLLEVKAKNLQHAACFRKADLPARFHYQNSHRIAPVVCRADEGYIMTSREQYDKNKTEGKLPTRNRGAHGYDNQLESMRAIFIGHGAAFKRGEVVEPFENVSVYHIITQILNLKPAPNDGNQNAARAVLKNK